MSPLDFGDCSGHPFKINVPEHTTPVCSRHCRINAILTKTVDAILNSHLTAGPTQHSTSEWACPLVIQTQEVGFVLR